MEGKAMSLPWASPGLKGERWRDDSLGQAGKAGEGEGEGEEGEGKGEKEENEK
jgi:hypothetical protein